jgi:hypothetical protein
VLTRMLRGASSTASALAAWQRKSHLHPFGRRLGAQPLQDLVMSSSISL